MRTSVLKRLISIVFILNASNSFAQGPVTDLRLDLDNAVGGNVSDIFEYVNFIPLETNKSSLFSAIDQLEVTDSFFIILDQQNSSLLLFLRNGKFHAKTHLNTPYRYLGYFSVNRTKKEILAIGYTASKQVLLRFDYDGNMISEAEVPAGARALSYFPNGSNLYHITRPARLPEADNIRYDMVLLNEKTGYKKDLKPYNWRFVNQDYNSIANALSYSGVEGKYFFSMPYEYAAYLITDTGIEHVFNFIFPAKYSLPVNFATDSSYAGKRAKYVYQTTANFGKIECLNHLFQIGDNLIFSTSYVGKVSEDMNYLYGLHSGKLVSLGRVAPDNNSSFIPILSHRFLEYPSAVFREELFTSIPTSLLFLIKNNQEKPVKYNDVLSNFFSAASKNDNPVIIQTKLKKGL